MTINIIWAKVVAMYSGTTVFPQGLRTQGSVSGQHWKAMDNGEDIFEFEQGFIFDRVRE